MDNSGARGRLLVRLAVEKKDEDNVNLAVVSSLSSQSLQLNSSSGLVVQQTLTEDKEFSPCVTSDALESNLSELSGNIILPTASTTEKVLSFLSTQSTSSHVPNSNQGNSPKRKQPDYYISPIHSNESEADDSDRDPNFMPDNNKRAVRPKLIPPISSSSSSSSCSTCSSSTSSTSKVGREDDNPTPEEQPKEEKRDKKRLRTPGTWRNNVAKTLRNSGKTYKSVSKLKRQIPERKLRPSCGDKCRINCKNSFDDQLRQTIFDQYWELGDLQRQREFIIRHSQEIKPKYRYSSTQDLRALNTAFYFEKNGKQVRVCKLFFKSTLDLNDRVIKTAFSKKTNSGFIEGELRGKHGKQPVIDPEIKKSVEDFINSIPRVESHYLRAQTTREFIHSEKCLADLYRDYRVLHEDSGLPPATSSTFNRIFNHNFNISFYIPKKDLCDLCECYKNSDEDGKAKLHETYQNHLKEKKLSREEKDSDKNRADGTVVAVYDLQAVMQVPKGQVSLFFYKSGLNCLNFTVSDLEAKEVSCYFWDETEGARGAVEIGSCILKYIQSLLDQRPNQELDIIFYSDNCCGQQKNKYLLSVYAFAVMNMRVNSITHKFLIRGHSQNEGDNVHSVIEKQIKRYLKSGPIYIPQTYSTLIRAAKKTGSPYKVIEMTHDKFYDVKMLHESWGNNFNMNENREQVKWHDIKILKVEKKVLKYFSIRHHLQMKVSKKLMFVTDEVQISQ